MNYIRSLIKNALRSRVSKALEESSKKGTMKFPTVVPKEIIALDLRYQDIS